jgi:hypothetical protein
VYGGDLLPYTEAGKKATIKHQKEKMDQISIRVKKGERDKLQKVSSEFGIPMRQYLIRAVNAYAGVQVLSETPEK